jgi:hypothetical protein
MSKGLSRRSFMKKSMAASAAGAVVGLSLEEKALLAKPAAAGKGGTVKKGEMPTGKIGKVTISRILCGGNLISGYAHSRDLVYVSPLLKHYFTDEKIMDTWQLCEEHGVNTMTLNPKDQHAVAVYRRYLKERGGKMQFLAQVEPSVNDLSTVIKKAVEDGACGCYLVGNLGDRWVYDNRLDLVEKVVANIKKEGVIAGVAGHALEVPIAVESASIPVDFYFKTMHSIQYWSHRRPDQTRSVIENTNDNYWDMDPEQTVDFMKDVKKPWIAYKVLAAGAIRPQDGFKYAFKNGADFACVGMFDWQIEEDVNLAKGSLAEHSTRTRPWLA